MSAPTAPTPTTQLILFLLSIQSSYVDNTETPATEEVFDTIQFFATNGKAWRIKTYATNEDVHIWEIGADEDSLAKLVETAVGNTEANYGDVLEEGYVMSSETGLDGLRNELDDRGLSTHLEETPFGAVFWAPPGTRYRTQSRPTQ